MSDNKWKPDFDKWYNVNKYAYKFIFEQAEKKLDDVLSESESITNKSIKMVAAIVAMFSFFIGFVIQKNIPIGYNAIFIVIFILNVAGALFLIFPKEVRGRGVAPKILIPTKLDNADDKEFQEEMLYYSGVVILQDNIDFMRNKNAKRAKLYLVCLTMALVLFSVGTIFIAISL